MRIWLNDWTLVHICQHEAIQYVFQPGSLLLCRHSFSDTPIFKWRTWHRFGWRSTGQLMHLFPSSRWTDESSISTSDRAPSAASGDPEWGSWQINSHGAWLLNAVSTRRLFSSALIETTETSRWGVLGQKKFLQCFIDMSSLPVREQTMGRTPSQGTMHGRSRHPAKLQPISSRRRGRRY